MSGSIVAFCMQGIGHLKCLLPLVASLRARGRTVHVLTQAAFRADVERSGGTFVDLFARYPLDAADASSIPIPARNVSFAGVYAEALADDVARLQPSLILHDTYAVVAPVIARHLRLPYVNVLPNHALVPSRVLAALRTDPRVAISDQCRAAVQRLRDVHGMPEATPFSYVTSLSPYLNLYPEPEEFLAAADRSELEPFDFFGCLAPDLASTASPPVFSPSRGTARRVYVSFGTVIWWYFAEAAYAALRAIAETLASVDVEVVISLGGYPLADGARAALRKTNVTVVDHVDQWTALGEADAFITHHGVNSTHEAIFHTVPMLSYPFFGDQPALARRCQDIGLALPLTSATQAAIEPKRLRAALAQLSHEQQALGERLAVARSWELRTIAGREAIVDHVLRLATAH